MTSSLECSISKKTKNGKTDILGLSVEIPEERQCRSCTRSHHTQIKNRVDTPICTLDEFFAKSFQSFAILSEDD